MRIVIEQSDFQGLSPGTQRELVEKLMGPAARTEGRGRSRAGLHLRKPVDLSEDMAARLLHGMSESHRRRLELFARQGGRVRQSELLAVNDDSDFRVLSHFQAVLTRRLRRFLDDPDRRAHLIGWDFSAEEWDGAHTSLVDGVYYVTDQTARSLQACMGESAASAGAS